MKGAHDVVVAFQREHVIPHCPQCSRPCCALTDVVLDLSFAEVKGLYRITSSKKDFDRALPSSIRTQGGRYYAHGSPCPAFDTTAQTCRVYATSTKPVGCSDFPVYEDGDAVTEDDTHADTAAVTEAEPEKQPLSEGEAVAVAQTEKTGESEAVVDAVTERTGDSEADAQPEAEAHSEKEAVALAAAEADAAPEGEVEDDAHGDGLPLRDTHAVALLGIHAQQLLDFGQTTALFFVDATLPLARAPDLDCA